MYVHFTIGKREFLITIGKHWEFLHDVLYANK
jgi:hypothetical protein